MATKKKAPEGRLPRRILIIIFALIIAALIAVGVLFANKLRNDRLAREAAEREAELLRRYPMNYTEQIRRYAADNDIDPAYVASVVLAESSYDLYATSSVGAQGLMQIMPETGEWIAGKFGETYVDNSLYDPDTNLRYGCWYLGFLMDRYGGDMRCASTAYHSGQGNVDKWLKDPQYSSDGRTFDVIPGENASAYVGRIMEYYEQYKDLYQRY